MEAKEYDSMPQTVDLKNKVDIEITLKHLLNQK